MAEEQLAPSLGEPEGVVAPSNEDAPPATRTVDDLARELGWKPKEEYAGDETEWRDAESFVRYGIERNRDLRKELRAVREDVGRIGRTSAAMAEQAADRARTEERQKWEGIHSRAVEEGNLQVATEAVTKIAELATPAPKQPQGDPLVERFVAENAWFNNDPTAQAVAVATTNAIAARGGSVAEQLEEARKAVHKRFPEYAPQQAKPAPSVSQPGQRVATTANRQKGFNDMPAEAQQACRELVRRNLATQEGYVAQYFNTGAA